MWGCQCCKMVSSCCHKLFCVSWRPPLLRPPCRPRIRSPLLIPSFFGLHAFCREENVPPPPWIFSFARCYLWAPEKLGDFLWSWQYVPSSRWEAWGRTASEGGGHWLQKIKATLHQPALKSGPFSVIPWDLSSWLNLFSYCPVCVVIFELTVRLIVQSVCPICFEVKNSRSKRKRGNNFQLKKTNKQKNQPTNDIRLLFNFIATRRLSCNWLKSPHVVPSEKLMEPYSFVSADPVPSNLFLLFLTHETQSGLGSDSLKKHTWLVEAFFLLMVLGWQS